MSFSKRDIYLIRGERHEACERCGKKGPVRYVEDVGFVCSRCILDEDMVVCKDCFEFFKWKYFPVKAKTDRVIRYRVCNVCLLSNPVYNKCEECGKKTRLRHVDGKGYICVNCISDDDLVLCTNCKKYHLWKDYPMVGRLKRRVCASCAVLLEDEEYLDGRSKHASYKCVVFTDKKEKQMMDDGVLIVGEDGSCRLRLDYAMKLVDGRAKTDLLAGIQKKIRDKEFDLYARET